MARAMLLVMDSVGIGGATDADKFGDVGADTLGHIAAACASGPPVPGPAAVGSGGSAARSPRSASAS